MAKNTHTEIYIGAHTHMPIIEKERERGQQILKRKKKEEKNRSLPERREFVWSRKAWEGKGWAAADECVWCVRQNQGREQGVCGAGPTALFLFAPDRGRGPLRSSVLQVSVMAGPTKRGLHTKLTENIGIITSS